MQTSFSKSARAIMPLVAGFALCTAACGAGDQDGASAAAFSAAALGVSTTADEAESLTRTASAIGSKVTWDAAASGSKYVEFNGTAARGAWIEFTLPNIVAGTYDLKFLFKANTNRGIVQASVDGANQGPTCNEYAASVAYQVSCSLGRKTLTAGNHKLRFTVVGKSSLSSGYQLVVDQISLASSVIGQANGTACISSSQCASGSCQAGLCQASGVCNADSACPAGQRCISGLCQASTVCNASSACPVGQSCVSGICQVQACGASSACPAGQVCLGGLCQASAVCSADSACPVGQRCMSGLCQAFAVCSADSACPVGQSCVSGACEVLACGVSSACPVGQVCLSGVCQTQSP